YLARVFRDGEAPAEPRSNGSAVAPPQSTAFRLKPMVKRIMMSRTYQLTATTRDRSVMSDDLHHSHALIAPLEAEQLLDALSQVTGVSPRFTGYPRGLRANQVPAPAQAVQQGGRRGS